MYQNFSILFIHIKFDHQQVTPKQNGGQNTYIGTDPRLIKRFIISTNKSFQSSGNIHTHNGPSIVFGSTFRNLSSIRPNPQSLSGIGRRNIHKHPDERKRSIRICDLSRFGASRLRARPAGNNAVNGA